MLDLERTETAASSLAHIMNPPSDQNLTGQLLPGRLSCDSYVSYHQIRDYGDRVRKSAEYYSKFRQTSSGPLVAAAASDTGAAAAGDDDDDDEEGGGEFGFSTPPVWGPTTSPPKSRPYYNHYRNLSPASKTQAIARGQMELMEMVSKLPESCYELSLRDIVEKQQQQQPMDEEKEKEKEKQEEESEKEVRKKMEILKKKNGSVRNNKNNEGLLLKMVFPLSFGRVNTKKKKKKKKSEFGSYSFKVAPRPAVIEGSEKSVDKEWWKKRFEASESESSGSSSHNGSVKSSISSHSIRSFSRNGSR